MHNKCPSCRGRKETLGLGSIFRTCTLCNGVGYVATHLHTQDKESKPLKNESKAEALNEEFKSAIEQLDKKFKKSSKK